jgi:hypothetical protein
MPDDQPFDQTCAECGMAIRKSRVVSNDRGEVPFYEDEEGLENRDFHFHDVR